jgi:hypothetical protein
VQAQRADRTNGQAIAAAVAPVNGNRRSDSPTKRWLEAKDATRAGVIAATTSDAICCQTGIGDGDQLWRNIVFFRCLLWPLAKKQTSA